MSMRIADRVSAVVLLASAAAYTAAALDHDYMSQFDGPGAGFLPFWLGIALATLSLLLLVSSVGGSDEDWLPDRAGLLRILAMLGATVLFVALMHWTGMILGTALFLLGVLRFLERYGWGLSLAIAIGVAAANWAVFTWWLRVPFPTGVLGV